MIGITGDTNATKYNRQPTILQWERFEIIRAVCDVKLMIFCCPLVVTQEFMEAHVIDLLVHVYTNDADVNMQEVFLRYHYKWRSVELCIMKVIVLRILLTRFE